MVISIKQENLTVSVELEENGYDKVVRCEEVMAAAFDIISRIYCEELVQEAYYKIEPDGSMRQKGYPVLEYGLEKGYTKIR